MRKEQIEVKVKIIKGMYISWMYLVLARDKNMSMDALE